MVDVIALIKQVGREEGEQQVKINTARKLLQRKMDLAEIAEITGLSEADINQIAMGMDDRD